MIDIEVLIEKIREARKSGYLHTTVLETDYIIKYNFTISKLDLENDTNEDESSPSAT